MDAEGIETNVEERVAERRNEKPAIVVKRGVVVAGGFVGPTGEKGAAVDIETAEGAVVGEPGLFLSDGGLKIGVGGGLSRPGGEFVLPVSVDVGIELVGIGDGGIESESGGDGHGLGGIDGEGDGPGSGS